MLSSSCPILEGYPAPGVPPSKWEWSKRDCVFSLEKIRANETAFLEGNEFSGWASKYVFSLAMYQGGRGF
jgi:hypothetical protein